MEMMIWISESGNCSFDCNPDIPFMLADAIKRRVKEEVVKFYKK